MRRRRLLGLGFGTIAVAIGGCTDIGPPTTGDDGDETDSDDEEVVKIRHHRLIREDEGTPDELVAVIGEVEVLEDPTFGYIEVQVIFLDESGEELDRTVDNLREIDDVDELSFRVEYPRRGEEASAVKDYEISIGTVI